VAAFVVLSAVSRQVRADHKVAFIWFGVSLALISTGELLVVPMMQSLLGQLAPRSAFTTAFLFVSMSVGYTLGGWVGTLYERLSLGGVLGRVRRVGWGGGGGDEPIGSEPPRKKSLTKRNDSRYVHHLEFHHYGASYDPTADRYRNRKGQFTKG
jgi:hypothetical protein